MFQDLSNAVRFLSIAQVNTAKSGHLGMPLGMADCLTVLFKDFLRFNPMYPSWPNRDKFVLSGGHGSSVLYSLLYLTGYENFTLDALKNFRKLNSITSGHPEYNINCGIETTTGLLGQGIANAVGMAIEERILNSKLGDDCINHQTYVCVGDGDLMEGVSHEACSLAGHLSLGNLIVLWDDNQITIDGSTDVSNTENILNRFDAYGWHTIKANGHDYNSIKTAIELANADTRPSIIACQTKIGFGSLRENTPEAHGGHLSNEELEHIKKALNWKYNLFEMPDYLLQTWRMIGNRHENETEAWINEQKYKYNELHIDYDKELRKVFRNIKKEYFVSRPFLATRVSSKHIIENITEKTGLIISGSCDLGGSTGCHTKNMKAISKNDFSGNYIHYGVREHAMAAIMNGIVCGQKVRTIGGTFLVFSDYMRPAIRMSALMNIPSIFIFTHDSIGVGEDGATHHPVEHLASLRSIPNLNVFRPADAMETLECFEAAMKSQCPSALILTRQDVQSVRFCGHTNLCEKGGYLLHNDNSDFDNKVTILVTGSETSIALEVKKMLNEKNVAVNVASIPCWKLFDEQTSEYKQAILGNNVRVAIEASNGFGWERYIGTDGLFFGVNDFGKSCSCKENYKYFKLFSQHIFERILKKLNKGN